MGELRRTCAVQRNSVVRPSFSRKEVIAQIWLHLKRLAAFNLTLWKHHTDVELAQRFSPSDQFRFAFVTSAKPGAGDFLVRGEFGCFVRFSSGISSSGRWPPSASVTTVGKFAP